MSVNWQAVRGAIRGLIERPPTQPEPPVSTYEQMKEVIDLADEFDKLQHLPIWEKLLRRLGTEVNAELVEATRFKYEPNRQVAHTMRWDAKRELLDNLLAWM